MCLILLHMYEFDTPIPKEARSVNLKYIGINKEEKDNILDTFSI